MVHESALGGPVSEEATATRDLAVIVDKADEKSRLTPAALHHLVTRPLHNRLLPKITQRRRLLLEESEHKLHADYTRSGQHDRYVRPKDISIPPRYGMITCSLATYRAASFNLESGSGFGISGMYILAGVAPNKGELHTFEYGDYAPIAQDSLDIINHLGTVYNQTFFNFTQAVPRDTRYGFVFIDALHDSDTIIRSFKSVVGWCLPGALLVFDDINFEPSMREGWRTILRDERVSFAARVGSRLGVIELSSFL